MRVSKPNHQPNWDSSRCNPQNHLSQHVVATREVPGVGSEHPLLPIVCVALTTVELYMKTIWTIYAFVAASIGIGGFFMYMGAHEAPQQIAAAGFSLAGVGVPYFILRGIQEIKKADTAHTSSVEENIRAAIAANPPAAKEQLD